MVEPVADTANAAAREAAEAAAKKIEDLCAQLVAKQAETDTAGREAAEAADKKIVDLRAQLARRPATLTAKAYSQCNSTRRLRSHNPTA